MKEDSVARVKKWEEGSGRIRSGTGGVNQT